MAGEQRFDADQRGGNIEIVHGTAVAIGRFAALIRGPSGSGKSDLALRCVAITPSPLLPHPATLIADDQVCLTRSAEGLIATCPGAIRNLLEVRGVGIVPVAASAEAVLRLLVDVSGATKCTRYPLEPEVAALNGFDLPVLRLSPFEASAPLKLLLALALAGRNAWPPTSSQG